MHSRWGSRQVWKCMLAAAPLAGGAAQGDRPVVEVFLPAAASIEMARAVYRAEVVAAEIYSEIGIRVVWRPAGSSPRGCVNERLRATVLVTQRSTAPPGVSDDALAFSNPYSTAGPCITLLMDRIRPLVRTNPVSTGFLLGHVLAHEIGHVLEGTARHSETGIMKSRWSLHETVQMLQEPLRFSRPDAQMVLRNLGSAP